MCPQTHQQITISSIIKEDAGADGYDHLGAGGVEREVVYGGFFTVFWRLGGGKGAHIKEMGEGG